MCDILHSIVGVYQFSSKTHENAKLTLFIGWGFGLMVAIVIANCIWALQTDKGIHYIGIIISAIVAGGFLAIMLE
jgi:short subunit fatty acids transporter